MVNHGDIGPEIFQEEVLDIFSVYGNGAFATVKHSQKTIGNGAFSCACSSYNTDLFSFFNVNADSFQDKRQFRPILHFRISKVDIAILDYLLETLFFGSPIFSILFVTLFGFDLHESADSLDRNHLSFEIRDTEYCVDDIISQS